MRRHCSRIIFYSDCLTRTKLVAEAGYRGLTRRLRSRPKVRQLGASPLRELRPSSATTFLSLSTSQDTFIAGAATGVARSSLFELIRPSFGTSTNEIPHCFGYLSERGRTNASRLRFTLQSLSVLVLAEILVVSGIPSTKALTCKAFLMSPMGENLIDCTCSWLHSAGIGFVFLPCPRRLRPTRHLPESVRQRCALSPPLPVPHTLTCVQLMNSPCPFVNQQGAASRLHLLCSCIIMKNNFY